MQNCIWFAHSFLRPELVTPARAKDLRRGRLTAKSQSQTRKIKKFVSSSSSPSFLLSSETFCYMRTDSEASRIREFFEPYDVQIKTILVIRNDKDWRERWQANLKGESYFSQCEKVTNPLLRVDSDWYYDVESIQNFWKGIGDLTVISYDHEMRDRGSIIPACLSAMQIDEAPDSDQFFVNTREAPKRKSESSGSSSSE